jgi:two-component system chemotaxis response regulator CheB
MIATAQQAAPVPGSGKPGPYRVMVVDDSAVIRGLLARTLEADPQIEVVASVGDGEQALRSLNRMPIEIVVLDIEMPVMDGLTALPKMLERDPQLKVIMASTLTRRNAEISLRALQSGASDYVAKPTSTAELTAAQDFKRELVDKVKALGRARRGGADEPVVEALERRRAVPTATKIFNKPIVLRAMPATLRPAVLAIGSSTGGPQALFEVLSNLGGAVKVPILISQHMPATFTAILAEHIDKQAGIPCKEAADGEPVVGGRAYIAPGNYHMGVVSRGAEKFIQLNQSPPENFCRPAVDVMLRSIVEAYRERVLVLILTGMGQDGLKGSEAVVSRGGVVMAQDRDSSVVWGMPGAVATGGLCSSVLPLAEIGPFLARTLARAAA